MSKVTIDDESSRLKQFIWEELDEHFFIAVIFRSDRRYFVQRHFEQQLFDLKSSSIRSKWRRCLLEVISNSLSPIYITSNEVQLMHEIFSWHLNYSNNYVKLRDNIDYLIDFEDLIGCYNSISLGDNNNNNNDTKSFILQPVTTLDAARKNIEMWKNLQENIIENTPNQSIDKRLKRKRTKTPILNTTTTLLPASSSPSSASSTTTTTESSFQFDRSSSTGWIQLDSKIVPFIKNHCDRLLPVEYLLKEHIITSSEDFSLRSLYIPVNNDDIHTFNSLIQQSSSSNFTLTNHSWLITLDHLIFRLKRLFFIRFISSPTNVDYIDYNQVVSFNGGLLTLNNSEKQHIPFIYINKRKYIPQINSMNFSSVSTFCMANKYELEYLRLITLYDYLSTDEQNDYSISLFSTNNLTLIPIDGYYEEKILTIISLNDFQYHECQRRLKQQKSLIYLEDNQPLSSGWWQPPVSSSKQKSLSQFKLQRPIFF
ncbi:unnamed protein product [Rotaria socialis]|uniref:Uncharacterized protein n=2 Tax=Rotaria socialis TaxID=392032 RepID=A0A818TF64_9BILA|nr:unnamed protein product [Rotaria socialis]CAF3327753.1 unnamed protein product [Rotaria socialis]CAF3682298.1 unnamed protein product [Rotaria socialis]